MSRKMDDSLRNYTCLDDTYPTSLPISTSHWSWGQHHLPVHTLSHYPHSQILLIDNFISPMECDEVMNRSKARMKTATVANTDGKSVTSEYRYI